MYFLRQMSPLVRTAAYSFLTGLLSVYNLRMAWSSDVLNRDALIIYLFQTPKMLAKAS